MKTHSLDSSTESFNQDSLLLLKPKFLPIVTILALGFSTNSMASNIANNVNTPPPPHNL
uniref:hypothetical protein n=1 Tax=Helicobacter sp. UBA3407 TaxID=1946588 RepID=UPI00262202AB|nr:hypothetical protein [Helicobacter sp. UBA3407]